MSSTDAAAEFDRLREVVERLHAPAPAGCPWCLEQTPVTLAEDLLKEAHEVLDAATRGDPEALLAELGDVLLLLLAQAQLAGEGGRIPEVIAREREKVVRRHPHIFGDASAHTPEEVLRAWQSVKRDERGAESSLLDGIPRTLAALLRSQEMQDRAGHVGFEWPDLAGVVGKLHEEIDELARAAVGQERVEEYGDVVFALVNLARRFGFSAELALHEANEKFARRFGAVEAACRARGARPEDLPLAELDAMWNEAKDDERRSG